MDHPAIYKIESPLGRVYIGQSWNVKRRMSQYKGNHCRNQIYLNNSILKYGWENHGFEIIHTLPKDVCQETMDRYEQFYMDMYKDCGTTMMNLRGAGSLGKMSDKTKEKMGNSRRGRKHSQETLEKMSKKKLTEEQKSKFLAKTYKNRKPAFQLSVDGIFMKKWGSGSEAAKALSIDVSTIYKALKGQRPSIGGFKWTYDLKNK